GLRRVDEFDAVGGSLELRFVRFRGNVIDPGHHAAESVAPVCARDGLSHLCPHLILQHHDDVLQRFETRPINRPFNLVAALTQSDSAHEPGEPATDTEGAKMLHQNTSGMKIGHVATTLHYKTPALERIRWRAVAAPVKAKL